MMRKAITFLFVAMLASTSMLMIASALQTEAVPVDPSIYTDREPEVWGPYIVWTRWYDMDDNDVISWKEPSWIMLHDISRGESWNITPAYDPVGFADFRLGPDMYYHARAPDIYGFKAIYEYQYADEGHEVHLYMYNITSISGHEWGNENTWRVPVPSPSGWLAGHEHVIYDDWIATSHWGTGVHLLYFYNYETNEYRPLVTGSGQIANDFGISENILVYTQYTSASYREAHIYHYGLWNGVETIKDVSLNFSVNGANQIRTHSVHENYIGISALDSVPASSWNTYVLDISSWNWSTVASSLTWDDVEDDIIIIDNNSTYDSYSPIIWGDYAFYSVNGTHQDVWAYQFSRNRTIEITDTTYYSSVSDAYGDKVVWADSRNSENHPAATGDNWDIYRTLTDSESVNQIIWNLAPVVLVLMIVGVIFGALKIFGESAGGL